MQHSVTIAQAGRIKRVKLDLAAELQAGRFSVKLRVYLSIFRALTLLLAAGQLLNLDLALAAPASVIIAASAAYTLLRLLMPVPSRDDLLGQGMLAIDLVVCAAFVWMTGGISSPFLLYSLCPVLAASFYYDSHMATMVAVASALNILFVQLVNPFYVVIPGPPEVSYYLIYVVAVSLAASLPYLVNLNLHQRLQSEFVAEERQRLSREIHDGTAQTLSSLKWHGELITRELTRRGVSLPEMADLNRMIEEARVETLESLQLLRRYSGCGQIISHLKNYLVHLKEDAGIGFTFNLPADELKLAPYIELQLLRICQEALNNIRKHAGASRINFDMVRHNGNLTVTIRDNGRGFIFKPTAKTSSGHGLNVMKERAASIGGIFSIDSEIGKGTTVNVAIPVKK